MAVRIRRPPDQVNGPLWQYSADIVNDLLEQGYSRNTIHSKLWLVARLSRWLEQQGLTLAQVTPSTLQRFEKDRWKRAGTKRKNSLVPILRYLRSAGLVPESAQPTRVGAVEELLRRYREYLVAERGVAKVTLVKYEHVARLFLNRPSVRECGIEKIDGASVTGFIAEESRICGIGATKNRVKGLRSLLRFLHQEGLSGPLADAVPTVTGWRDAGLPKGLEPEEQARLLDSCDESTVVGRRDRAILMLLARMGLRAGEVAALELQHFDWQRGEVVIPGKGGRDERLPLPVDVGETLAAYILGGRPKLSTGRLFLRVQAPQGSIGVESVKEVVRRACRRAGIQPVGPHCLRHGVASQALAAGASLVEVGQVLRHRNLSTTAIYGKVDRARLRELARPWPGGTA
jgi:integrase/recombinase XerD